MAYIVIFIGSTAVSFGLMSEALLWFELRRVARLLKDNS